MFIRFIISLGVSLMASGVALAQQALPTVDPARVEATVTSTFAGASADWKAKIALDETQRLCTINRNQVSTKEANDIQDRESKNVVYPANGKLLGDWKRGYEVANNGRGGQFSDAPDTVPGGNCFACHQLDPKEVSYGTLGPSLAAYGRERKYDQQSIKDAWKKIYNSQAVFACSNMPRFGANKFLSEQQISDVMAYLFDPQSPVNK